MPHDTGDIPEPERYPPPWTCSPSVKWLIVAAYTVAIAALMCWWGFREVR